MGGAIVSQYSRRSSGRDLPPRKPNQRNSRKSRRRKKASAAPAFVISVVSVAIALAIVYFPRGGAPQTEQVPQIAPSAIIASAEGTPKPLSDLVAMYATPAPTQIPTETLENCLANSAFLGNSLLGSVQRSNLAPECDLFVGTGMNVKTALEKPTDTGTVPMVDELNGHAYDRVFTMFGVNELNWPNPGYIVERYVPLIEAIRERQPNAKLYMISILPLTKGYKSSTGKDMDDVNELNAQLAALCEQQGVTFIDVTDALVDDEGFLPAEASSDGHHLHSAYAQVFIDEVRRQVLALETAPAQA